MADKKVHILKTDKTFKQLIPPLSSNEQKQLEENIMKDGCREPLCIWGDTIVDGHNRYEICNRLKIPFHIQEIEFNNREEVIVWICANQLGRRNISEETRKYLIGKRYKTEKKLGIRNPSGKNQHSAKFGKYKLEKFKRMTAEEIGKEYQVSERTVRKYANYAHSIDLLSKKDSELIPKILSGKIKLSGDTLSDLVKQPPKIINSVKNRLSHNNKFISYSDSRKIIPGNKEKLTIKDMPAYDPDAEISSLSLTVPSWVSSIDRTLSAADFSKISDAAKNKLRKELKKLEYTINVMLLALEEK